MTSATRRSSRATHQSAEPETLLWHFNRTIYNTDRPNNLSWGIADFLAGHHVMVAPRSAMVQVLHAHFSKTGRCNTYLMAEGFLKSNTGVLFFAKESRLKADFNIIIRGMREFGILDYLYRQGVANASECLKPIKADIWRSLDQGDFYGIFSIYAGGEH
ncbi:hypothetical protein Pmani_016521 [Petrolisthes manimaculis]|uniref:Uncharacterized protein n=1 Tax=Petrolisthes manimaculis TaxID=1843537 RepID=A0AAE1PPA4_9EUCA|nr:hypothetical protein Pmani_016521 [Petrolisthes manimaculis]